MTVIHDFEHYLNEVLNLRVKAVPWKAEASLPVFLRASYFFYEISLAGNLCLAMVLRDSEEVTPATIDKHMAQVQKKWQNKCIYICKTISSYNRKRLIERCIPFVVPGAQSYLPDLGIDLREHFRKEKAERRRFLSPAAQAIAIHGLVDQEANEWTPSILAKELDYSVRFSHDNISRV